MKIIHVSGRQVLFTFREMTKLLIYLIFGSLISCALHNEFTLGKLNQEINLDAYPQKWQLVKMSGQMRGSETTGEHMPWQEYYILNSDDTFVKQRKVSNKVTEAKGKYEFVIMSDGKYLKLTHESNNKIIGNCTSDLIEHLRVDTDQTLSGTWLACDGPGLTYQRVN